MYMKDNMGTTKLIICRTSGPLLLLLLLLLGSPVRAQKRNFNWVFGSGVWVQFSPDSVKGVRTVDMPPVSARSASISDTTGQFRLLADDAGIRNALLEPVPGGTAAELGWNVPAGNYLLLPWPGRPGHYAAFINELPPTARAGMVEVDVAANGGAGAVVGEVQWYMQGATAKLAATTDRDDQGYWVLQHAENDDTFHAFRFGEDGLAPYEVVSHAGPAYVATDMVVYTATDSIRYNFFRRGAMTFNFQGDLLATIVNNTAMDSTRLELFHFDRTTGAVAHWTGVDERSVLELMPCNYPAMVLGQPFFRGVDFEPKGRYMCVGLIDSLEGSTSSWLVKFALETPADSLAGSITCVTSGQGSYHPLPRYDNLYGPVLSCSPWGHTNATYPELGEGYFLYRQIDGVMTLGGPDFWGIQVGGELDFATVSLVTPNLFNVAAGFPQPCKRYHDEVRAVGLLEPTLPRVAGVFPNPMAERAVLEFNGSARPEEVVWRNPLGQVLRRDRVGGLGPSFVLERRGLPNGLYLLEMLAKDRSLGMVRVMCE